MTRKPPSTVRVSDLTAAMLAPTRRPVRLLAAFYRWYATIVAALVRLNVLSFALVRLNVLSFLSAVECPILREC